MMLDDNLVKTDEAEEVRQDTGPTIFRGHRQLYTLKLMNCLCVMAEGEGSSFGMLHVSPRHPSEELWIREMLKLTQATQVVLTGANREETQDRTEMLRSLLAGMTVVDQTRHGWFAQATQDLPFNAHGQLIGGVLLDCRTGRYRLYSPTNLAPLISPADVPQRQRGRRGGAHGCCKIQ